VAAASACNGTSSTRATSRARYGHDEETERVAASDARSVSAERPAALSAPANCHGHQVVLSLADYYIKD